MKNKDKPKAQPAEKTERAKFEETLRLIIEGTANVTGEDFLQSMVRHLASVIGFRYVLVGTLVAPGVDSIRTLAVWANGKYADNFEYDLAGTPCANVISQNVCIYPKGIQQKFPDDRLLTDMGVESYMGIPLIDSSGEAIGVLVALHDESMEEFTFAEPILKIFAARTVAEIEREELREKERSASRLLRSLNHAQVQFIKAASPHVLFDELLYDLLELTQSQYGFIAEVLYDEKDEAYIKIQAFTNIVWDKKNQAFYEKHAQIGMEFHNLNNLFGAVVTTGKPVIANNPANDPRKSGMPKGHPPLDSFLGIPFYYGKELVGMVGIANRPTGYDNELIDYLQPLLITCSNIIEAYRTRQQRKHARKALRESEDRYRLLVENIELGITLIDTDYNIVMANATQNRLFNKPASEVVGKKCFKIFEKRKKVCPNCPGTLAMKTKLSQKMEIERARDDGTHFTASVMAFPTFGPGGVVTGFIDVVEDITEYKLTEKAQLEGEKRYHSLFENSPISLWEEDYSKIKTYIDHLKNKGIKDYKEYFEDHPKAVHRCLGMLKVIDVNKSALELYQAESKEELKNKIGKIFTKESYSMFIEELIAIAEGETVFESESITRTLKGKKNHVVIRWSVAPGYEETLSKVLVSVIDITKRKQAEKDLLREKDFSDIAINSLPGIFYLFNEKGIILRWNERLEEISEYSAKEISSMKILDFVPKEDKKYIAKKVKEISKEGSTTAEAIFISKSGKKTPYYFTGLRMRIGKEEYIIGTGIDITERKRIEEQLRDNAAELRKHQIHLERLVEDRTTELTKLNKQLKTEIAERKQAEEEIRLLAKFPAENPNPIVRIKNDGTIQFANQASKPILNELKGKTGHVLSPEWQKIIKDIYNSQKSKEIELTHKGQIFSLKITPFTDTDYLYCYGRNITEFKQAMIEVFNYRQHLEDLVEERTTELTKTNVQLQEEVKKRKLVEEDLKDGVRKLKKITGEIISAMAFTVEMKDPYTAGHQRRVTDLARAIATELSLSKDLIEGLRMAAAIHDIGKINVPVGILNKPCRLTETEFGMIKIHPKTGCDILKTIEFPRPVDQIVLQHHERMNGSGYPLGLAGEEIIMEARILAVADVIEAMCSRRLYRPTPGLKKALEEISQNRGVLYDPNVVDAALTLFSEKEYKFK